jgi:hypothetical protein
VCRQIVAQAGRKRNIPFPAERMSGLIALTADVVHTHRASMASKQVSVFTTVWHTPCYISSLDPAYTFGNSTVRLPAFTLVLIVPLYFVFARRAKTKYKGKYRANSHMRALGESK